MVWVSDHEFGLAAGGQRVPVALRDRVSVENVSQGWMILDEEAETCWWLDRDSGDILWALLGSADEDEPNSAWTESLRSCACATRDYIEDLIVWLLASDLIEYVD